MYIYIYMYVHVCYRCSRVDVIRRRSWPTVQGKLSNLCLQLAVTRPVDIVIAIVTFIISSVVIIIVINVLAWGHVCPTIPKLLYATRFDEAGTTRAQGGSVRVRTDASAIHLGYQYVWELAFIQYETILYYAILYYTILYYTILYYTILYYTILYYTILYYTILYYTILYYTILYYTILYYTILYYTILYYTILYYTILYYTILYYTILYYTILYYTILYYTILYYTILYYTILYYTILYYTILYYTILYYTILYYTILYHIVLYPSMVFMYLPLGVVSSTGKRFQPDSPRRRCRVHRALLRRPASTIYRSRLGKFWGQFWAVLGHFGHDMSVYGRAKCSQEALIRPKNPNGP